MKSAAYHHSSLISGEWRWRHFMVWRVSRHSSAASGEGDIVACIRWRWSSGAIIVPAIYNSSAAAWQLILYQYVSRHVATGTHAPSVWATHTTTPHRPTRTPRTFRATTPAAFCHAMTLRIPLPTLPLPNCMLFHACLPFCNMCTAMVNGLSPILHLSSLIARCCRAHPTALLP